MKRKFNVLFALLMGVLCFMLYEDDVSAQLDCTNPATAAIGISASASICEGDPNPAFSVTGCDPTNCLTTCEVDASCAISINIVVDHTFVGDLDEWHLIGPGGVDLGNLLGSGNPSGSGTSPFDFTFTTASGTAFPAGAPGSTGTFQIPAAVLTAIAGQDINSPGWGVQIYDCVSADAGYIVSAALDIDCTGAGGCIAGEDVISYSLTGSPATSAISDGTCDPTSAAIVIVPPRDLPEAAWYDAATGGTMVGMGNTFTSTETAPGVYSYFVQCACDLSDCPAARPQVDLTIDADPVPQLTCPGPISTTDAPVDLAPMDANAANAATGPATGMLSGTGVSGNSFDPSGLTPGDYTVTYELTSANGLCVQQTQCVITVTPPPCVINSADVIVGKCEGNTDADNDPTNDMDVYTFDVLVTFTDPYTGGNLTLDISSITGVSPSTMTVAANATDSPVSHLFTGFTYTEAAPGAGFPAGTFTVAFDEFVASAPPYLCEFTGSLEAQDECSCFRQYCGDVTDTSDPSITTPDGVLVPPTGTNPLLTTIYILTDPSGAILQTDDTDPTLVTFDMSGSTTGVGSGALCQVWAVNYDETDATTAAYVAGALDVTTLCNPPDPCLCIDVSFSSCYIEKLPPAIAPTGTAACVCQGDGPGVSLMADCDTDNGAGSIVTWFDANGAQVGTGAAFDPVAGAFVSTLTPGVTSFFAQCTNADGCTSPLSAPINFEVKATPDAPAPIDVCVCADGPGPIEVSFELVTGNQYMVYTDAAGTPSGLGPQTAPIDVTSLLDITATGVGIQQLYISELVEYTPVPQGGSITCESDAALFELEVVANPDPSLTTGPFWFCADAAGQSLNDLAMPAESGGEWFVADAMGNPTGSAIDASFVPGDLANPDNITTETYMYVYVLTSTGIGATCPDCTGTSAPVTINICPAPDAAWAAPGSYCGAEVDPSTGVVLDIFVTTDTDADGTPGVDAAHTWAINATSPMTGMPSVAQNNSGAAGGATFTLADPSALTECTQFLIDHTVTLSCTATDQNGAALDCEATETQILQVCPEFDPTYVTECVCCDSDPFFLPGGGFLANPGGFTDLPSITSTDVTGTWTGSGVFVDDAGTPADPTDDFYWFDPRVDSPVGSLTAIAGPAGGTVTGQFITSEGEWTVQYEVGDQPCENEYVLDFDISCPVDVTLTDDQICTSPSNSYNLLSTFTDVTTQGGIWFLDPNTTPNPDPANADISVSGSSLVYDATTITEATTVTVAYSVGDACAGGACVGIGTTTITLVPVPTPDFDLPDQVCSLEAINLLNYVVDPSNATFAATPEAFSLGAITPATGAATDVTIAGGVLTMANGFTGDIEICYDEIATDPVSMLDCSVSDCEVITVFDIDATIVETDTACLSSSSCYDLEQLYQPTTTTGGIFFLNDPPGIQATNPDVAGATGSVNGTNLCYDPATITEATTFEIVYSVASAPTQVGTTCIRLDTTQITVVPTPQPYFSDYPNAVCMSDPDFVINVYEGLYPDGTPIGVTGTFFDNTSGMPAALPAWMVATGDAVTVDPTAAIAGDYVIGFSAESISGVTNCSDTIYTDIRFFPSYDACFAIPDDSLCVSDGPFLLASDAEDIFGQTTGSGDIEDLDVWTTVDGNGNVVTLMDSTDATGYVGVILDPRTMTPGVYTINHQIGADACADECVATIVIKPAVDATLEDTEICVSTSGQTGLTALFTATTSTGGSFSAATATSAEGAAWTVNGYELNYDPTGTFPDSMQVVYSVGTPGCCVTAPCTDIDGDNDCYDTDTAWVVVRFGVQAFLDLPETICSDDTLCNLFNFISLKDANGNVIPTANSLGDFDIVAYNAYDEATDTYAGYVAYDTTGVGPFAGDITGDNADDVLTAMDDCLVPNTKFDGFLTIRYTVQDPTLGQCMVMVEDNIEIIRGGTADFKNPTPVCAGDGAINLTDLTTAVAPYPYTGNGTACGVFEVIDENGNLVGAPDFTVTCMPSATPGYPAECMYLWNPVNAGGTEVTIRYTVGRAECQDVIEMSVPVCEDVVADFATEDIELCEGSNKPFCAELAVGSTPAFEIKMDTIVDIAIEAVDTVYNYVDTNNDDLIDTVTVILYDTIYNQTIVDVTCINGHFDYSDGLIPGDETATSACATIDPNFTGTQFWIAYTVGKNLDYNCDGAPDGGFDCSTSDLTACLDKDTVFINIEPAKFDPEFAMTPNEVCVTDSTLIEYHPDFSNIGLDTIIFAGNGGEDASQIENPPGTFDTTPEGDSLACTSLIPDDLVDRVTIPEDEICGPNGFLRDINITIRYRMSSNCGFAQGDHDGFTLAAPGLTLITAPDDSIPTMTDQGLPIVTTIDDSADDLYIIELDSAAIVGSYEAAGLDINDVFAQNCDGPLNFIYTLATNASGTNIDLEVDFTWIVIKSDFSITICDPSDATNSITLDGFADDTDGLTHDASLFYYGIDSVNCVDSLYFDLAGILNAFGDNVNCPVKVVVTNEAESCDGCIPTFCDTMTIFPQPDTELVCDYMEHCSEEVLSLTTLLTNPASVGGTFYWVDAPGGSVAIGEGTPVTVIDTVIVPESSYVDENGTVVFVDEQIYTEETTEVQGLYEWEPVQACGPVTIAYVQEQTFCNGETIDIAPPCEGSSDTVIVYITTPNPDSLFASNASPYLCGDDILTIYPETCGGDFSILLRDSQDYEIYPASDAAFNGGVTVFETTLTDEDDANCSITLIDSIQVNVALFDNTVNLDGLWHLVATATNACGTSEYDQDIYLIEEANATLVDATICSSQDDYNLTGMFSAGNTTPGGSFSIGSMAIAGNEITDLAAGCYTVTYEVAQESDCYAVGTATLTIIDAPEAEFTTNASPTICAGQDLVITLEDYEASTSLTLTNGTSTTLSVTGSVVTYAIPGDMAPGLYTLCHTVSGTATSECGDATVTCTDEYCKDILISEEAIAVFNPAAIKVCEDVIGGIDLTQYLAIESTDNESSEFALYDPATGATYSNANILTGNTFNPFELAPDTFYVQYGVNIPTGDNECSANTLLEVVVVPAPTAAFTFPACLEVNGSYAIVPASDPLCNDVGVFTVTDPNGTVTTTSVNVPLNGMALPFAPTVEGDYEVCYTAGISDNVGEHLCEASNCETITVCPEIMVVVDPAPDFCEGYGVDIDLTDYFTVTGSDSIVITMTNGNGAYFDGVSTVNVGDVTAGNSVDFNIFVASCDADCDQNYTFSINVDGSKWNPGFDLTCAGCDGTGAETTVVRNEDGSMNLCTNLVDYAVEFDFGQPKDTIFFAGYGIDTIETTEGSNYQPANQNIGDGAVCIVAPEDYFCGRRNSLLNLEFSYNYLGLPDPFSPTVITNGDYDSLYIAGPGGIDFCLIPSVIPGPITNGGQPGIPVLTSGNPSLTGDDDNDFETTTMGTTFADILAAYDAATDGNGQAFLDSLVSSCEPLVFNYYLVTRAAPVSIEMTVSAEVEITKNSSAAYDGSGNPLPANHYVVDETTGNATFVTQIIDEATCTVISDLADLAQPIVIVDTTFECSACADPDGLIFEQEIYVSPEINAAIADVEVCADPLFSHINLDEVLAGAMLDASAAVDADGNCVIEDDCTLAGATTPGGTWTVDRGVLEYDVDGNWLLDVSSLLPTPAELAQCYVDVPVTYTIEGDDASATAAASGCASCGGGTSDAVIRVYITPEDFFTTNASPYLCVGDVLTVEISDKVETVISVELVNGSSATVTADASGEYNYTIPTANADGEPYSGLYTVVVTGTFGPCTFTEEQNIFIIAVPDASINDLTVCEGSTNLTTMLDPNATPYGSFSVSGTAISGNEYDFAEGTYTIGYSVGVVGQCFDAAEATLTVIDGPDATFTATSNVCADDGVAVAYTGTDVPDSWEWTFGETDGTVIASNTTDATTTFATSGLDGLYQVCLTVTNTINGIECVDTECSDVYIVLNAEAGTGSSDAIVCEGTVVDLVSLLSGQDEGGYFTVGTDTIGATWVATTTTTVTYHVGIEGQCYDNTTITVTVTPGPDASFAYAENLCAGTAFDLADATTAMAGGAWTGSFVDAFGTAGSIPSDTTGLFTLVYTVTDGECSDVQEQEILIIDDAYAAFTPDNVTVCLSEGSISLNDYLSPQSTAGGTYSTGSNIYELTAAGVTTVTYTVGVPGGDCGFASATLTITVVEDLDAAFTTNASPSICAGQTLEVYPAEDAMFTTSLTLTNGASTDLLAEGTVSMSVSGSVVSYDIPTTTQAGLYTLCHSVATTDGECADEFCADIIITEPAIAEFNPSVLDKVCEENGTIDLTQYLQINSTVNGNSSFVAVDENGVAVSPQPSWLNGNTVDPLGLATSTVYIQYMVDGNPIDQGACIANDVLTINIVPKPTGEFDVAPVVCMSAPGEFVISPLAATTPECNDGGVFTLLNAAGGVMATGSNSQSLIVSGGMPGIYTVSYTVGEQSCQVTTTAEVEVCGYVTAGQDNSEDVCEGYGVDIDLLDLLSGATEGGNFELSQVSPPTAEADLYWDGLSVVNLGDLDSNSVVIFDYVVEGCDPLCNDTAQISFNVRSVKWNPAFTGVPDDVCADTEDAPFDLVFEFGNPLDTIIFSGAQTNPINATNGTVINPNDPNRGDTSVCLVSVENYFCGTRGRVLDMEMVYNYLPLPDPFTGDIQTNGDWDSIYVAGPDGTVLVALENPAIGSDADQVFGVAADGTTYGAGNAVLDFATILAAYDAAYGDGQAALDSLFASCDAQTFKYYLITRSAPVSIELQVYVEFEVKKNAVGAYDGDGNLLPEGFLVTDPATCDVSFQTQMVDADGNCVDLANFPQPIAIIDTVFECITCGDDYNLYVHDINVHPVINTDLGDEIVELCPDALFSHYALDNLLADTAGEGCDYGITTGGSWTIGSGVLEVDAAGNTLLDISSVVTDATSPEAGYVDVEAFYTADQANYGVLAGEGYCGPSTGSKTIRIYVVPEVLFTTNASPFICAGDELSVSVDTSLIDVTNVTITNSVSVDLATTDGGATWTLPLTPETAADPTWDGLYTVTVYGSNGPCEVEDTKDVFVIGEPNATINDATVCAGVVNLTTMVDVNAYGGGNFTINGNAIQGNEYDLVPGTYTIGYSVGVAGQCYDADDAELTVVPTPDAFFTTNGSPFVCAGDDLTANGADGTWTLVDGTAILQTATGATATFATADLNGLYTIVHTVTNSTNGVECTDEVSRDVIIVLDPDATVADMTACEGVVNLTGMIDANATPGGAFAVDGSDISGNEYDFAPGTYAINYSVGAAGCQATASATLTITPYNDPSATVQETACAGGDISIVPNGNFGSVAGTLAGYLTGDATSGFSVDAATPEGLYSLIHTTPEPCGGSAVYYVYVYANPTAAWADILNEPWNNELCSEDSPIDLTQYLESESTSGGNFSGTGVIGNTFYPATAGAGVHTITYTVSTPAGCTQSFTTSIEVQDSPDSSFEVPAGNICIDLFELTSGWPLNPANDYRSEWTIEGPTGASVSNNILAVTEAGTYTITHTVSYGFTCVESSTQTIVVDEAVTAGVDPMNMSFCQLENATVDLNSVLTGTSAGGVWTDAEGNVIEGPVDVASLEGPTTHVYTYTVGNGDLAGTACFASVDFSIIINEVVDPSFELGVDSPVCGADETYPITPTNGPVLRDVCDAMISDTLEFAPTGTSLTSNLATQGFNLTPLSYLTDLTVIISYQPTGSVPAAYDEYSVTGPGGVVLTSDMTTVFEFGPYFTDTLELDEIAALYGGLDALEEALTCTTGGFTFNLQSNSAFYYTTLDVCASWLEVPGYFTINGEENSDFATLDVQTGTFNLNINSAVDTTLEVCYTTEQCMDNSPTGSGCNATACETIEIIAPTVVDILDAVDPICGGLSIFFLESLYTPATQLGGTFSINAEAQAAGAAIFNSTLLSLNNINFNGADFVEIEVTYTVPANGPCPEASDNVTITIYDGVDSDFYTNASPAICAGADLVIVPNSSNGTTSQLIITNDGTVDLLDPASGAVVNADGSITYALGDDLDGLYYITHTVTNGDCSETTTTPFYVVREAIAELGDDVTLCEEDVEELNLLSFLSENTTGGGTFTANGVAVPGSFIPEVGTTVVTYYVGAEGDACTDASDEMTVTVNATPDVSFLPAELCSGADAIALGDGYTVNGEAATSLDPASAGTYTVTATSAEGCSATATVEVYDTPTLDGLAESTTICEGTILELASILGGATDGGEWTGFQVEYGDLDADGTNEWYLDTNDLGGFGSIVTYTVGYGDCATSATVNVIITDAPDAAFFVPGSMCADDAPFALVGAGTFTDGDGNVITEFDPAQGSGVYEITHTIDGGDCSASVTNSVAVLGDNVELGFTTSTGQFFFCEGDEICLTPNVEGGTWACANGSVTPTATEDGCYLFTYDLEGSSSGSFAITYEVEGSCGEEVTKVVNVFTNPPKPEVEDQVACAGQIAPEIVLPTAAFDVVIVWASQVDNDTIVKGNLGQSLAWSPGVLEQDTTVWVSYTNLSDCEGEREAVTWTVESADADLVGGDLVHCDDENFTMTVTGGPDGATYVWTSAEGEETTTDVPVLDATVPAGTSTTYGVIYVTPAGCESDPAEFGLTNYEPIAVSYEITAEDQIGGTYMVTFTISGGSGEYSYNGTDFAGSIYVVTEELGTDLAYEFSSEGDCSEAGSVDAPEPFAAIDDQMTTDMNQAIIIDVNANDPGAVCVTTDYSQGVNGGLVALNSDCTFTYTPPTGFCGTDSFTYTAVDAAGNEATATVFIVVDCPVEGFEVLEEIECNSEDGTFTVFLNLINADETYQFRFCGEENWTDVTIDDEGFVAPITVTAPADMGAESSYCVEIRTLTAAEDIMIYSDENISCVKTAIELLTFDGRVLTTGNELFWITASEQDNDFFTVERSLDGINFTAIGDVDSKGNSNVAQDYDLLDALAPIGISYYRLLATDMDGKTEIASQVIALERRAGDFTVTVAPVPSSDVVNINFESINVTNATIVVMDVTGKIINEFKSETTEGVNTIQLDIRSYAAGTYLLSVQKDTDVAITRFIKE